MEIISEDCDLPEFCTKVMRRGFMKVLQAASAEITYQKALHRERTGHLEFRKGSRQAHYCDDLMALIRTLTNGSFPADRRPGLVRDLVPLMKELLKEVRFCGNVEELITRELVSASVEPYGDPLCVVVSRQEVEAANIDPALSILTRLIASPAIARANQERVDIAFDGYNHDPTELYEIPKVRDYVHALDDKFAFWLFFLTKHFPGLQCLMLCFLLPYLTEEAKAETHPKQLEVLLLKRWIPAMNWIAEYAGLNEEDVLTLTNRSMAYLMNGPIRERH